MHDPMTVAFEIRYPWRKYGAKGEDAFLRTYREPFITIWHVDPEKRGDDDSCDWFGRHRPVNAREKAITEAMWDLETLLDNRPHYPDSREHQRFQVLKAAVAEWRRRSGWRIPVRWHVWHWRIQLHPIQDLKRWAFTRCVDCGGRFAWGESGVAQWNSNGPRWLCTKTSRCTRSLMAAHKVARWLCKPKGGDRRAGAPISAPCHDERSALAPPPRRTRYWTRRFRVPERRG